MNEADIINGSLYYLVLVMFATLEYNPILNPTLAYSTIGTIVNIFNIVSVIGVILLWVFISTGGD